jgi:hypothetical protein
MDRVEQVKKLREEYERALDAAESRRSAYHAAVLELYQGGTPLREIAKELGLSHQRVHQIVSGEPPRRSKLPRAAGGIAGTALILAALTFGALRLAHAPPFTSHASGSRAGTPRVRVPNVLNEPVSVAVRRLENAGLRARVVHRERNVVWPNQVYAQAGAAGEHVVKGSVVTIVVATPTHWGPFVASRGATRSAPGGAVARKKREVIARATPVGRVSIWVAPDRVSRGSRCSWLQIGRTMYGWSCYHLASRRGLPESVSPVFPVKRSGSLPLIWGRANGNVGRLTLVFRDGTRVRVPVRDGVFLYAAAVPSSSWHRGHQPASLVATDTHGRVIDKRLLCWTPDGVSYASSVCASRGKL